MNPIDCTRSDSEVCLDTLTNQFAFGIVVLNDRARVVRRNHRASTILDSLGIAAFPGGKISTVSPDHTSKLDALINKLVFADAPDDRAHSIELDDSWQDDDVQIWGTQLYDTGGRIEQGGIPCAVLLVIDSKAETELPISGNFVNQLVGLTPDVTEMARVVVGSLSYSQTSVVQSGHDDTDPLQDSLVAQHRRPADAVLALSRLLSVLRYT